MLFLLTGDVQIGKTRWLERLCTDLANAGTCVAGVIAPGQWVPRPEGQPGGKHGFDGAGRFEKLGIDNVLLPQGERIEFARRRDLTGAGQAFAEGSQAKAAQLGWAISDEAIAQVNSHFANLSKQVEAGRRDGRFPPLAFGNALQTSQETEENAGSSDAKQSRCPESQACKRSEKMGQRGCLLAPVSGTAGTSTDGFPTAGPTSRANLVRERPEATGEGDASIDSAAAPHVAPGSFLVVDELGRLELLRGCGLTNAVALLDAGPTPTFPHALAVVRETLLDEAVRRFEPAWGTPQPIAPTDEARKLIFDAFKIR